MFIFINAMYNETLPCLRTRGLSVTRQTWERDTPPLGWSESHNFTCSITVRECIYGRSKRWKVLVSSPQDVTWWDFRFSFGWSQCLEEIADFSNNKSCVFSRAFVFIFGPWNLCHGITDRNNTHSELFCYLHMCI